VFRRLAVFADSFDIAGADAVAGWGEVDARDVLDIVLRLVDKSLIVPSQSGDAYRYRMLETLRQYGRDELMATGEYDRCVAALFQWARAWTERLQRDMRTPQQDASLAAADIERDNLRAVFEQARAAGENELALRIATFAPSMRMRERRDALDELLDTTPGIDDSLRGHALTSYAQFSFGIGDWRSGRDAGERAAELFDKIGDRRLAAWARYFVGFATWGHVPDDEVRRLFEPALATFRELDQRLGIAYVVWVHSQLERDLDAALTQAAEAEAEFRSINAPFGLAHCLEGCARIRILRDEPADAVPFLREALGLLEHGEPGCVAHLVEAVASVLTVWENYPEAATLLGAAEQLRATSGHAQRPWELRSREHAERLLAHQVLDAERDVGRAMDIDAVVVYALQLLDRAAAVVNGGA
jgi:non-specific serine/threonine protein kinase